MSKRAFEDDLLGVEWNGLSVPELTKYDRKLREAKQNGEFVSSTEQATVRRIRASVKALSAQLRAEEIEAKKAEAIARAIEAKAKPKAITEAETDVNDHAADFAVMAAPDVTSPPPFVKEQPNMYLANEDDGADFGDDMSDGVVPHSANNVDLTLNVSVPAPVEMGCPAKRVSFGPNQSLCADLTETQNPAPKRLCPSVASIVSSSSTSSSATNSVPSVKPKNDKVQKKPRLTSAQRLARQLGTSFTPGDKWHYSKY